MKRVFCSLMMVIAMLVCFDQGNLIAAQEKTKFYQLTFQTENVAGQMTINGFVVTEIVEKSGNGTAALNTWLIGDNELKAEVKKIDPSKPGQLVFGVSEIERGGCCLYDGQRQTLFDGVEG